MIYQVLAMYSRGPAEPFGSRRVFAEARKLAILAVRLNHVARFKIRAIRDHIGDPAEPPELWIRR